VQLFVRPRRVGLTRPLIFLKAVRPRLPGPDRPEDEEPESVQRYLHGPGYDGEQDRPRTLGRPARAAGDAGGGSRGAADLPPPDQPGASSPARGGSGSRQGGTLPSGQLE
jgi:hypothetical protein